MSWLARQKFLGDDSEKVFKSLKIAIIGLGGAGSHIAQQLAHIGIGNFVLIDPQCIEDTNLNRLVGGTWKDVENETPKVDIAERVIRGVQPDAKVAKYRKRWQEVADDLKSCDVTIGGLDQVRDKDELEGFCRRFMTPYIDIGMDVHAGDKGHFIGGQVILSLPGTPCLRCYSVVTQAKIEEEARNYGDAGPKPQVVWPNGILASTAVGLTLQLVSPWHPNPVESEYLQYDGNAGTMARSPIWKAMQGRACSHHSLQETGDPSFDLRKMRDASSAGSISSRAVRFRFWSWFMALFG